MAAVDVMPEEDQPLSLKMMRLRQPSLNIKSQPYYEPEDFDQRLDMLSDCTNFSLSSQLKAPGSLDVIYLGETFQSYLSVNSEVETGTIHGMTLKVELQATYRHIALIDTTISPKDIVARESVKFMVRHEVKELGMHFLLCSVHYLTPNGDRKFFKKIYKVNVLNPLAVKTKANHSRSDSNNGTVLLEVQVQNLSSSSIFLEKLDFEPTLLFSYQDLNFSTELDAIESNELLENVATTTDLKTDLEMESLSPKEEAKSKENLDAEPKKIPDNDDIIPDTVSDTIESQSVNPNNTVSPSNNETKVEEQLEDEKPKDLDKKLAETKNSGDGEKAMEPVPDSGSSTLEPIRQQSNLDTPNSLDSDVNVGEGSQIKLVESKESEFQNAEHESNFKSNPISIPPHSSSTITNIFGKHNYLKASDTRQYLYKLQPRTDQALIAAELGKLDIVWRTRFGEMGRLQTSQLTRKIPTLKPVSLEVLDTPSQVQLESPFELKCQVKNLSDRIKPKVEIKIQRSKMDTILYMGNSPILIPPMLPGDSIEIKLMFLPMAVGLHKITGLSLIDEGNDMSSTEYSPEVYVTG